MPTVEEFKAAIAAAVDPVAQDFAAESEASIDFLEGRVQELETGLLDVSADRDRIQRLYDEHMATHGPATVRRLGGYDGNASEDPDARWRNLLGFTMPVTYTYTVNNTINEPYHGEQVKRGEWVMIGLDPKGLPGRMTSIKNQGSELDTWLRPRIRAGQRIALAGKAAGKGGRVAFNFGHEAEVKRNQGVWTHPEDALIATYVAAHDVFVNEVRALAPDCEIAFVSGGWTGNRDVIAETIQGFTEPFDIKGWDPYVTMNDDPNTTATQLFGEFGDWMKAQSWFDPAWKLWIPEFGFYRNHGADKMAAFYRGVNEGMEANNIEAAFLFNRDKTSTHLWRINSVPQAVEAFRSQFPA